MTARGRRARRALALATVLCGAGLFVPACSLFPSPEQAGRPSEPPGSLQEGLGDNEAGGASEASPAQTPGSEAAASEFDGGRVVAVTTRPDLGVELLEVSFGDPTIAHQFFLRDTAGGKAIYLPTAPNFVTLLQIVSRDEVRFLADGRNSVSGRRTFPFVIDAVRQGDAFVAREERTAIPIAEPVTVGDARPTALVRVELGPSSITLSFGARPGFENLSNAAASDVPHMELRLGSASEGRAFVVHVAGTTLGPDVSEGELAVPAGGLIRGAEIEAGDDGVDVVIALSEAVTAYSGTIGGEDTDEPWVTVEFQAPSEER